MCTTYCERLVIDQVIDTPVSPRNEFFPHMPSAAVFPLIKLQLNIHQDYNLLNQCYKFRISNTHIVLTQSDLTWLLCLNTSFPAILNLQLGLILPFPSMFWISHSACMHMGSQGLVSTSMPSFSHHSAIFPLPFLVRGFVVLLTDTLLSHPPFPLCPLPPPPPLVKLLGQTHLVFRLAFACEQQGGGERRGVGATGFSLSYFVSLREREREKDDRRCSVLWSWDHQRLSRAGKRIQSWRGRSLEEHCGD